MHPIPRPHPLPRRAGGGETVRLPRPLRPPAAGDLRLGDVVTLAVGRTVEMLVVDLDGSDVTAARRTPDGVRELVVPRAWLRKVA